MGVPVSGPTPARIRLIFSGLALALLLAALDQAVVATALDALGRQPTVVSGWFNWLQSCAGRFLPRPILTLIAGNVMAQWTRADMR